MRASWGIVGRSEIAEDRMRGEKERIGERVDLDRLSEIFTMVEATLGGLFLLFKSIDCAQGPSVDCPKVSFSVAMEVDACWRGA